MEKLRTMVKQHLGQNKTLLALLLVINVALAACGGVPAASLEPTPTPTATPVPTGRGIGGTLRLLYWQAPTILNPHLAVGQKDWGASRISLEPLATFDREGNLIPILAEEIPSLENGGVAEDGRSVTWMLKRGVKWSDGTAFTAADVLFTYDFISNPETGSTTKAVYDAVERVEYINDRTVTVHFNDVTPAWFLPFVGVRGMILPKHLYEQYNGTNAAASAAILPVGTGPYKAVSFEPQEVLFLGNQIVETNKIVYEPNEFYRDESKPYFSEIELRGGGTVKEAARSVFQVGDVDYALNLQLEASDLDKMEAGGKGTLLAPFGAMVERILLNRTDPNKIAPSGERSSIDFPNPILSDLKVRQALVMAIDREAIAKLYGSIGRPVTNVLVSPEIYASPNTSYEFNLEKAAALLDEAGWVDSNGDGFRNKDGQKMSLSFQTSDNAVRQQTQRLVRQSLGQIGIEVQLEVIPSAIFFSNTPSNPDTRFHFYADLEEFQTGNRSPDPETYMQNWTCNQIAQKSNDWSGQNIERWCNKDYDALYQQSTVELDPEKRKQLFIQMNDLLINDVVVIPLVYRPDVSGVSNTIEGVNPTPWDDTTWNIADWRRK